MPSDQKHFATVTKGHTVIMGRNTYESILGYLGKPLPNRVNIVVTHNMDFTASGCTVVHSLEEALKAASLLPPILAKEGLGVVTTPPSAPLLRNGGEEEIFVIGGSQLYAEALPKTDKVYRTLIHTTLDGDAFFPTLPTSNWQLATSKLEPKDDKNPFDATYEVYERIAK